MLFIVLVVLLPQPVVLLVEQFHLGLSRKFFLIKNHQKRYQVSIKVYFNVSSYLYIVFILLFADLQLMSLYCKNPSCGLMLHRTYPSLCFLVTNTYAPPHTPAGKIWGYWVGNWMNSADTSQSFNLSFNNTV